MCLNLESYDEKSLEVNKHNCCSLHEQLEIDFENLKNEEILNQQVFVSLQKEK